MSNFIDPTQTTEIELGGCQCSDGSPRPHLKDVVTIRTQLGFGDYTYILDGIGEGEQARRTIEVAAVGWNLLGPGGQVAPVNRQSIALLHPARASQISEAIDAAIKDEPLPNPGGAPSPDISSENGVSRQTMKELETSTTPS